jgi:hypothetical protein
MDDRKEQRADGPEKKSVSERRGQANRENARKSTGPKTLAGKERAKMNAVKHGILCGELIIKSGEGTEDLAVFDQLFTGLREHYKPVGTLEDILVQKMAGYLWKERRAQLHEAGAIQRQIAYRRDLEPARSEARFRQALAAGAGLEQSTLGIQHLLKGLEAAIAEVQRGAWSIDAATFLTDHFRGCAPEKPMDSLPNDTDSKKLVKKLTAQRDRLLERVPEVEGTEKREAEARIRGYMLPEGHELDLVLRYEAAIDRKLHKVMDRLRQVQADRRAAEAAPAAGDDQPAEQ